MIFIGRSDFENVVNLLYWDEAEEEVKVYQVDLKKRDKADRMGVPYKHKTCSIRYLMYSLMVEDAGDKEYFRVSELVMPYLAVGAL